MLMNVLERKQVTEAWKKACDVNGIVLMVQIGGAPYPDVVELAKHAEKLQVDGVLCLPELYFKPKSPEKLTDYLKNVAVHCPSIPFFYYHIPMFTDVNGMLLFRQRYKLRWIRNNTCHCSTHANVLGYG